MSTTPEVYLHEKRAERLKTLIEASQVLARVESLDMLLPKLLVLAQDVTYTEGASILLFDQQTQKLRFTLAVNDCRETAQSLLEHNIELELGEGIAGYVGQTLSPVIVNDVACDTRFSASTDCKTGFVTRNLMCAPIVHQDELLGVIQVLNAKERKEFDDADMELLESFSGLGAVALIRSRLMDMRIAQERMQAQLDAAARIQSSFWPAMPDLEPHALVWAKTEPAVMVGGDFYDCILGADDSILVAVGDVSGKGLPAALVGAALWARMRSLAAGTREPGRLLTLLNEQMQDVFVNGMFATMLIARIYPATGKAQMCCAGHNPPVVCAKGACRELDIAAAFPLGLEAKTEYPVTSTSFERGEHLVFYTDGVTEARSPSRKFYGEERLLTLLQEPGTSLKGPAIVEAVRHWRNTAPANDDVTVLEVHFK